MSKDYTHIKANGIRNELKEIRKSIDKLTAAIVASQTNKHQVFQPYTSNGKYDPPYIVTSDAQTNKLNENGYDDSTWRSNDELRKCKNKEG